MDAANFSLPPPAEVLKRIESCQKELVALRRLLRASQAAAEAADALRQRQEPAAAGREAARG